MKLQIDKFLALTAMMATAQLGSVACVAADKSENVNENVEGNDDGGADEETEGEATASSGDTSPASETDPAETVMADAGSEGGDTSTAEIFDAGSEGGPTEPVGDAGGEGVIVFDGGMTAVDAGSEGIFEADAAAEDLPLESDAGGEGVFECLGGTFDATPLPDCALFDSCIELLDYAGTAYQQCWDQAYNRRASVYDAFASCVSAAAITDPCGEEGDFAVSDCAWQADQMACAEFDPACEVITGNCSEVLPEDCSVTLAPYDTFYRGAVADCVQADVDIGGINYAGCGAAFQACALGPSAE
jgi:hypothetical protein